MKCVTVLFVKIFFQWGMFLINKTQQMCDKALDDGITALKFFPDWFFTSKII